MRGKIKVMAQNAIQLRVFARNNAIEINNITVICKIVRLTGVSGCPLYLLPGWEHNNHAGTLANEWVKRGGTLVKVLDQVVLGRKKMTFTPKLNTHPNVG
jgi:hypothetical protein